MRIDRLLISAMLIGLSCNSTKSKNPDALTPYTLVANSLFSLPNTADEASGLDYSDSSFFVHNDSGGAPLIYQIDTRGEDIKTWIVPGAQNIDWECLDIQDSLVTVGDVGNNNGNRTDLSIYQIDMRSPDAPAEVFTYAYKNQKSYDYPKLSTPYDCEALFSVAGEYYTISKNWETQKSSLYNIKPETDQVLKREEVHDFGILVTGADYLPERKLLVCSGYMDWENYIILFIESTPRRFFTKKPILIKLKNFKNAQVEGVCFMGPETIALCSEKTEKFAQQIWTLKIADILAFQDQK